MIAVKGYQIAKAEAMLASIKGGANRALANALNRAALGARTDAVQQVTKAYMIKANSVRDTIKVKHASVNSLIARIESKSKVMPLIKFKVVPNSHFSGGKRPAILRAEIKRGETKLWHGAFIINKRSGGVGVFVRKGKDRLPIKEKFSLSVPQMLGSPNISKYIEENAVERLDKNLDHEINRILRGYGG